MAFEREGAASERGLVGLALALGAGDCGVISAGERALALGASRVGRVEVAAARRRIAAGEDALGEALLALRSARERRPLGAVYTPAVIVRAMADWAAAMPGAKPVRVVDAGAGSGRFLLEAGRTFPKAELVGVELDPLAALLLRANLVAGGFAKRSRVIVDDFRDVALDACAGRTLFVGNPPYVRHHALGAAGKRWFAESARKFGFSASKLAGLHVHFALATALQARPGDLGVLVTAAEWLDVHYGALLRELFLGPLGGLSLHLIEPTARPFADADTTAAITCFEVGTAAPSIQLRRVRSLAQLSPLTGGRKISRELLARTSRWTPLTRPAAQKPAGYVELGELCHVHRGQVTGHNRVWIAGEHSASLPSRLLYPAITKARELFAAGHALSDARTLRKIIDLPADLGELGAADRRAVERFLRLARELGADRGFVAQHRKAWWSVGLRAPAPILATYMARRPPAFVRNLAAARHINIAHGLYPREPLSDPMLDALALHLSKHTQVSAGRTYSGGLTKFEPKEMERLWVPGPGLL